MRAAPSTLLATLVAGLVVLAFTFPARAETPSTHVDELLPTEDGTAATADETGHDEDGDHGGHGGPDHEGKEPPRMSDGAEIVEHEVRLFRPDPQYGDHRYDPAAQYEIYGGKHLNKTARPILELGRPLYDRGALERGGTWLGEKNPTAPHLMAYGDFRLALAHNDDGVAGANGDTSQTRLAARFNLDIDIGLTGTERLHFFVRPIDAGGSFTRYEIDGGVEDELVDELDFNLETAFFEGELGEVVRGITGRENKIDLAFALGLLPIFTQNGVWIEDAFLGFGFTFPAFSVRDLGISNVDLTFFAGFDKVTTAAVAGDHAAELYGIAGFVEANTGYWEFGYGYTAADDSDLSYHNLTVAFSRRYGGWLSNSVRLLGAVGQDAPDALRTADGVLLLLESSLITRREQTFVPYANFFVGWERPVSLARAAGAGGVLKNTGILFETDGITGFPQLDDRGQNAWGGAAGLIHLFSLDRQLVLEAAVLQELDDDPDLPRVDDSYALGFRYQQPITNAWILRFDFMHAWRDVGDDVYGGRIELRRKF